MSANTSNSPIEFTNNWMTNGAYFDMLRFMASLSRLFSENSTPYLDYRLAENLFCKYFDALNYARSCMAYDAGLGHLGVGIKTFCISQNSSVEKIAEFNKLKPQLDPLKGYDLAVRLSQFRNDRIDAANSTYDITDSIYHIVGRKDNRLVVFNSPYDKINVESITEVKDTPTSISFYAGGDFYSFNKSKSVLQKRFDLPDNFIDVNVDILEDPLEVLYNMLNTEKREEKYPNKIEVIKSLPIYKPRVKGYDYVVLPLFSVRGKVQHVPDKSGLNQWNANGRRRDPDEVYIAIPRVIHRKYPNFFPDKDHPFELHLPDGNILSAKLCQAGAKALMSNPNAALGKWILRKVLHIPQGHLVRMEDLVRFGIDSVLVEDMHSQNDIGQRQYRISFTNSDYESFNEFISEE